MTRVCSECSWSCTGGEIAHCNEIRAHRAEKPEPEPEIERCDSCEDGEAVFVVRVHRLHNGEIGEYCDSMRVCADCARDESWLIARPGTKPAVEQSKYISGESVSTADAILNRKDPRAQRAIERLQTLAKGYRLMHVDDPESLALITRADEVEHCLEILQECFQEAPRERLS